MDQENIVPDVANIEQSEIPDNPIKIELANDLILQNVNNFVKVLANSIQKELDQIKVNLEGVSNAIKLQHKQ